MFRSISINGRKRLYANDCANDLWIREIVFPGKRKGYFVEAGAADGVGGSSCYFLEKDLGWRGLCIEPSTAFFNLLLKKRPNSIPINACLARETGPVDFVEAPMEGGITPYHSGVRDVLLHHKYQGEAVVDAGKTVAKPAVRLADLLDANHAPSEIDYGAFDIEGSEFEALRDFPFDRYRFLALSFEVDGTIAEQLDALLLHNGYVQTRNPYNQEFPAEQYWLHKSIADRPPAPQIASTPIDHLRDSLHNSLEWLAGKLSRVTSSREYIPEIDGLRCIALLGVLFFHSTIDFLWQRGFTGPTESWSSGHGFILHMLSLGWFGVELFFVISGFVVALPFARHAFEGAPAPRLGRYFLRRVTRIEPPYILALIAMYVMLGQYTAHLPHLLAGLFYVHQYIFGTRNPVNEVTWSLEVEIVFYILAPWLTRVYFISRRSDRWMAQLVFITVYSYMVEIWIKPHGSPRIHSTIVEFLPYFMAGILLADLYASGLVQRSGRLVWDIVVLGSVGATLYEITIWREYWVTPMLVFLILLGAFKGRIFNRLLRLRPITIIGGMCYTGYLWHIPLLRLFYKTILLIPSRLDDGVASLLYCILIVPILLICTAPIFYFLEKPFMNGPGASFLERILRAIAGLFQRKPIAILEEAD